MFGATARPGLSPADHCTIARHDATLGPASVSPMHINFSAVVTVAAATGSISDQLAVERHSLNLAWQTMIQSCSGSKCAFQVGSVRLLNADTVW